MPTRNQRPKITWETLRSGQAAVEFGLILVFVGIIIVGIVGVLYAVLQDRSNAIICELYTMGRPNLQESCEELAAVDAFSDADFEGGQDDESTVAEFILVGGQCAGVECSFDASGSSSDSGIVLYEWNFGDGSTGTGIFPTHRYSSGGTYLVELIVTNGDGIRERAFRSVVVDSAANTNPGVTLELLQCVGLTCEFLARTFEADLDPLSYEFSFGDPTNPTPLFFPNNGQTQDQRQAGLTEEYREMRVSYTYPQGGVYQAQVRVRENTDRSPALTAVDTVTTPTLNGKPVVGIGVTDNNPSYTFRINSYSDPEDGTGIDKIAQVVGWTINGNPQTNGLSDGDTRLDVTFSGLDEFYEITVTVQDSFGTLASATLEIDVNPGNVNPPPTGIVNNPTDSNCTNFTCTFEVEGHVPSGYRYEWTFGDGSPVQTSTARTFTHVFPTTGSTSYNVRLDIFNTITNTLEAFDTETVIVPQTPNQPPTIDVGATELTFNCVGDDPTNCTLTVSATDPEGDPISYRLVAPGTTFSYQPTATFSPINLSSVPNQTVLLDVQARDNQGAESTVEKIQVTVPALLTAPPVVNDITASCGTAIGAASPLTCDLTIISAETINFGLWTFPSTSTTGTGTTIRHTFDGSGASGDTLDALVEVIGRDDNGVDSAPYSETLTLDLPPEAFFTENCTLLECDFTSVGSRGTGANGIDSYNWDFGVGASPANSTQGFPSAVTYASSGNKTVTLTITSAGYTATYTETISINAAGANPEVDSVTAACGAGNVPGATTTRTCILTVSEVSGLPITGSDWTFQSGDLAGSAPLTYNEGDNTVEVTFSGTGSFTVTVSLDANSQTSPTKNILVNVPNDAAASFSRSPADLTVDVNASTSSPSDGSSITSYAWNFGQSGTTTDEFSVATPTTSYTYSSAGTYTITLTITDAAGNQSTTTRSVTVTEAVANQLYLSAGSISGSGQNWTFNGTWSTSEGGVIGTGNFTINFTVNYSDGTSSSGNMPGNVNNGTVNGNFTTINGRTPTTFTVTSLSNVQNFNPALPAFQPNFAGDANPVSFPGGGGGDTPLPSNQITASHQCGAVVSGSGFDSTEECRLTASVSGESITAIEWRRNGDQVVFASDTYGGSGAGVGTSVNIDETTEFVGDSGTIRNDIQVRVRINGNTEWSQWKNVPITIPMNTVADFQVWCEGTFCRFNTAGSAPSEQGSGFSGVYAEWTWGDGSPVETDNYPTREHNYGNQGTRNVTLTITDNVGNRSSVTKSVNVAANVNCRDLDSPVTIIAEDSLGGIKNLTGTQIVLDLEIAGDGGAAPGQTNVTVFFAFDDFSTDTQTFLVNGSDETLNHGYSRSIEYAQIIDIDPTDPSRVGNVTCTGHQVLIWPIP